MSYDWQPGAQINSETFQRMAQEAMRNATGEMYSAFGLGQQPSDQVSQEDRIRMKIRRCGNICLMARDRGWTVAIAGNGNVYEATFLSEDGRRVPGPRKTSKQAALVSAADHLETYGFLND